MLKELGHLHLLKKTSTFSSQSDVIETRDNKDDWKTELLATMKVFPDFITPREEDSIFQEVEPYMKRLRYEFSHWDDVSISTVSTDNI